MEGELELLNFGPCCACEKEGASVRNLIMLEHKAPVPGIGWGCVQCGLPYDGAVAVVCDDCIDGGRPIKFAIAGPANDKKRVPIESLGGEHKHDMSEHPEVAA